jgi:hypothetical protein
MQKYGLLTLLCSIAIAFGQNPTSVGTPGSIQGRVTNSQTGDGIGGTTLRLFPRRNTNGTTQPASTVSQDDGSFRFDSVNPGTYILFVQNQNYSNQNGRLPTVTVTDGQHVSDIAFQLNPLGSLTGKVFDDEGKPFAKATVQLYMGFNLRGKMQLRRTHQTTSDANGKFHFDRMAAGKYYLTADTLPSDNFPRGSGRRHAIPQPTTEAPPVPAESDDRPVLVRTFYPQSLTLEGASVIEMTPGSSQESIEVWMRRVPAFSVLGQIAGFQTGDVGSAMSLTLAPRDSLPDGGLGRRVRVQKDETFAIGRVTSGSYTLWLIGSYSGTTDTTRMMRGGRRVLAREDIEVNGANVSNVQLAPLPPINLTGQVVLQDGTPNGNLGQIQVLLVAQGQGTMGRSQNVAPDTGGNFAIKDLDPGDYTVRVFNAPTGMYVQSITLDRQDVKSMGMNLSQGGSGGQLQIALKAGASEVDGTAGNGGSQKIASGTVLLIPAELPSDGSGTLTGAIGNGGTFAIRNVPPGHYLAFAVQQWSSIWQNADFLQEMQREGESVEVPENGRAQVDVSVLPMDQLQLAASRVGLSVQ